MEIKQLKYFVVAADMGSFSEAARVLYTTQSSVSKVIGALEKELGYPLFERANKGISLTYEGGKFHSKATQIVTDFEEIEAMSQNNSKRMVKISFNHSSWLANCFSKFYEPYKDSDVCFSIHTDSTSNIIKRLRYMEDEIGFVYVFPDTRLQFEYELKKYNLEFEKLRSVNGMIYFQPDEHWNKEQIPTDIIHSMKYIQSEHDEYLRYGSWITENGEEVNIKDDIGVITNSDYVMHAFLEKNALANLSADSFNSYDMGIRPGIKLINESGQIDFGIITNNNGKVRKESIEFVTFIKNLLL